MKQALVKIVLVGDPTVGKSSIRRRYLGQGFHSSHMMTIGADFASKNVIVEDKLNLTIQIWDLAGQQQFAAVRSRFYLGISGAMLVYDVTNKQSLANVEPWLYAIKQSVSMQDLPILIVGNKIDLEKTRKISNEKALHHIKNLQEIPKFKKSVLKHVETSALSGINIEFAFKNLANLITQKLGLIVA